MALLRHLSIIFFLIIVASHVVALATEVDLGYARYQGISNKSLGYTNRQDQFRENKYTLADDLNTKTE